MPYTSINDSAFAEKVSIAEAYRILEAFVAQYHARGESSTGELLADIGIGSRGESADPAQLADFLTCAREIIARRAGDRG